MRYLRIKNPINFRLQCLHSIDTLTLDGKIDAKEKLHGFDSLRDYKQLETLFTNQITSAPLRACN